MCLSIDRIFVTEKPLTVYKLVRSWTGSEVDFSPFYEQIIDYNGFTSSDILCFEGNVHTGLHFFKNLDDVLNIIRILDKDMPMCYRVIKGIIPSGTTVYEGITSKMYIETTEFDGVPGYAANIVQYIKGYLD